ncbi:response regulator transcription factor [Sansalvadorimonas verongulae]|uniref:LytR/AlgR family response regulator transcription factor n=1 Tax=Sansalvadorimonas verongulae TaxID=2172824 RepID=UPI002E30A13A|nr:LytTR family DNA-binding domain-containing protein [Sansalvadorimonas verongulae]MTI15296.1 response regulator transcription factor [Sansalvadorimonas verongulae]
MKVLVCDDEPLARERMRIMLDRITGVEAVKEEAGDGQHALQLIEKHTPDIVLLDIRMPGMDGLACAQHIARMDTPPAVIFCTAYNDHALDAFKAQAVDYLLKPVRQAQLEDTLQRAQRLTRSQLSALNAKQGEGAQQSPDSHISARTHKGIELIPVDDITLFHADHKYVTVHYSRGEVLIDESLKSLQSRLGESFVRIHRNALVAHDAIENFMRNEQGFYEIHIRGKEHPMVVSRRHVASVRRLLSNR